ncbi:MAG: efflux RND transporter periplasmic adaptor subunit [Gammaproteobacteria bacterium]
MFRNSVLLLSSSLWMFTAFAEQATLQSLTIQTSQTPEIQMFDGTVEAVNQATISAEVSGRIEEILVDVDDYVEQGAEIIRFRNKDQAASLKSARARLQEARALFANATSEYNRTKRIYKQKLIAKSQLDKAESSFKAAQARVESAKGDRARAEEQMERTRVRAPYAGIVTKRLVEKGEAVSAGQALVSGVSLEQLRVSTWIPQRFVAQVRKTPRAIIYKDNNPENNLTSEKLTLFPVADELNNSFRLRLALPPGQHGLYPGTLIKIGIPLQKKTRITIPADALVQRSELTAVYLLANEQIRLRQVRTGHRSPQDIEILAGLTEGDVIILDPVAAAEALKNQASGE